MARFLVKSSGGYCGSTVLMGSDRFRQRGALIHLSF